MRKHSTIPADSIASSCTLENNELVWKNGRNAGLIKGVSMTLFLSACGAVVGSYFLKKYHDEQIQKAQIESIEAFISSGGAAKYANNPTSTEPREYQLAEMSSKQDWEVIVRYKPNKHRGGNTNG